MRVSSAQVMLEIAQALAQRSTCSKLSVGAVLVDRSYRIIGSGYNGVPRDCPHCIDFPCAGATAPKGADLCEAVHAEQNALLNCHTPDKIYACYITHAPCMRCTKTLLNTGCEAVVFLSAEFVEPAARELWLRSGRAWFHQEEL